MGAPEEAGPELGDHLVEAGEVHAAEEVAGLQHDAVVGEGGEPRDALQDLLHPRHRGRGVPKGGG